MPKSPKLPKSPNSCWSRKVELVSSDGKAVYRESCDNSQFAAILYPLRDFVYLIHVVGLFYAGTLRQYLNSELERNRHDGCKSIRMWVIGHWWETVAGQ